MPPPPMLSMTDRHRERTFQSTSWCRCAKSCWTKQCSVLSNCSCTNWSPVASVWTNLQLIYKLAQFERRGVEEQWAHLTMAEAICPQMVTFSADCAIMRCTITRCSDSKADSLYGPARCGAFNMSVSKLTKSAIWLSSEATMSERQQHKTYFTSI